MIGKSTYIRSFTPDQVSKMEAVAKSENLKTVPDILFHVLDAYSDQKKDIERLNRIIEYKQAKINQYREAENVIE